MLKIGSGGQNKSWKTRKEAGVRLQVRDVPLCGEKPWTPKASRMFSGPEYTILLLCEFQA